MKDQPELTTRTQKTKHVKVRYFVQKKLESEIIETNHHLYYFVTTFQLCFSPTACFLSFLSLSMYYHDDFVSILGHSCLRARETAAVFAVLSFCISERAGYPLIKDTTVYPKVSGLSR